MNHYRSPRIFPAIFIGLIFLLIGSSILMHLFFPFYHIGYYGWLPFFPWGGFFFLRTLLFLGLLFFIARRFFWGPRWAYRGTGWAYRGRGYCSYLKNCGDMENTGVMQDRPETDWVPRGPGQFREYRHGRAPFEKSGSRNTDDYLELVSGFGTVEKKVNSRKFQGGDVTTTMGRLIIDLRDADFTGTVRLKVTQIQGTTTILTPMEWDVKPGEGTIFSTYQDSKTSKAAVDPDKVLIIDGTCVSGGIEVRTR
jgi:hypothetical protein